MARILFLSANPDDTDRLKVEEEFNKIWAAIRSSEYRDQFELEQRHAVSLADLHELVLEFKPNIIHFSGHGSPDGLLVFEGSAGLSEDAPIGAFANLFRIINHGKTEEDRIRCVVLNACYSGKRQAAAIARHVDCVIGTSSTIKDSSAINFAESFYRALGYGESVQKAFDLGRNQLDLYGDPDENIIRLQPKEGRDPSAICLVKKSQREDANTSRMVDEIRECGLELLTQDYFMEHRTTENDIGNWKKGFPFKLEAIKENHELRRRIVSLIEGKLHEQMAILLTGESGASKSTILMEIICDYFDKGYSVLYNLFTTDIRNSDQLTRNLKELLRTGEKVLVAVDDVHTEKSAALFFVMDQLSSFELRQNIDLR